MTDTRLNPPFYRQNERATPLGIAPGSPPPMFHEPAILFDPGADGVSEDIPP